METMPEPRKCSKCKNHPARKGQKWCNLCANEAARRRWQETRRWAIRHLGGKCVRCGFSDPRALQIDHINGGGRAHRRQYSYTSFYLRVAEGEFDGLVQLLCANCNQIKKEELREYGNVLAEVA